jgi:hypothetical protein
MHDQGQLPVPREGGVMAELIACVREAKKLNDSYMTQVIGATKRDDN